MKLKILLTALRKEEHKEVEKFLQSPFFKESEQFLLFFKRLCMHFPDFEVDMDEMRRVYQGCFGKEGFSEGKLYNLMSGVSRQLELYFVVKQALGNRKELGHFGKFLLVQALGQRGAGAYFRSEADQFIEEIVASSEVSVEDLRYMAEINSMIYFHPGTTKYLPHSQNLEQAIHAYDQHHSIIKLRLAAEALYRKLIFNSDFELPLLDELLAEMEKKEQIPLIALYLKLVAFYKSGIDKDGFGYLKDDLALHFSVISKDDKRFLIQHLINIGVLLTSQDVEVQVEMLELYKMILETGLLLEGDNISSTAFVNIATLAALTGDFDWGWNFVNDFRKFLDANIQPTAVKLASANLYYMQGKLDEAQSCLTAETYYLLPGFDIVTRGLLLKIIFDRYIKEGKDYEFLTSHISAYERFVGIKQLSEEKKQAQLNYIKFVKKMTASKFEAVYVPEDKKKELGTLLQKITPIVSKKWLESRIGML